MKVKQKDILNVLKPYSMEVMTPCNGLKIVKMDEFLAACINQYKKQSNAVNVRYKSNT